MSHTHKHELAHALRNGQAAPGQEPFPRERWGGDTRRLRSRLKTKSRRMERHAWPNPMTVEDVSARERQPQRPAPWRH